VLVETERDDRDTTRPAAPGPGHHNRL